MRLSIPALGFLLAFTGSVYSQTEVEIRWVDDINTIQTGYVVERKVGAQPYEHLVITPGADTRRYTDTAPVLGQTNCYVVYARGPAGPSGFSSEACVAVPTTPAPGPGEGIPLACEGSIGAGGRIEMVCTPQVGRR